MPIHSRAAALAFAALCGLWAGGAKAAEVALVEDVINAPSAGVQVMDYLVAGQVIRLGPNESVIIDYLSSCWRESITGGGVTIGTEQSLVEGGTVSREKVECDGGKLLLTAEQAAKSGVMVFRKILPGAKPALTLYGASPLIDLPGGGRLVLERLDKPGEKSIVEIAAAGAGHAPPYDFAKHDMALAPGGTYRATVGETALVFKVANAAKPGASPMLGRLIRF